MQTGGSRCRITLPLLTLRLPNGTHSPFAETVDQDQTTLITQSDLVLRVSSCDFYPQNRYLLRRRKFGFGYGLESFISRSTLIPTLANMYFEVCGEDRVRSTCLYVQSDLAVHSALRYH